jgi:hypothetical protein
MTSQIALLNHLGVALASDSVVSFDSGRNYSTVNKIFSLAGRQPVGIMICGSARYNPGDVAWERVIGLFRQHIGDKELPELNDYVNEFQRFVTTHEVLNSPRKNDLRIQEDLIELFTNRIVTAASAREEMLSSSQLSDLPEYLPEVGDYFSEAIESRIDWLDQWRTNEMKEKTSDDEWMNHLYTIKKKHQKNAKEASEHFVKRHNCSKSRKKMEDLFVYHLASWGHDTYWKSGSTVVFVGFGENQITPELTQMNVGANVNGDSFANIEFHVIRPREDYDDYGKLASKIEEESGIKRWSGSAMMTPFAVKNEIQNILNGIHEDSAHTLREVMPRYILDMIRKELLELLEETEGVGKVTINRVTTLFDENTKRLTKGISKEVRVGIHNTKMKRRERFRFVTARVPMKEMSSFARTLVSLEAQIAHYSKDRKIVGGPIDLATITKEDGFLWVDTKQEIDSSKNPRQSELGRDSANLR